MQLILLNFLKRYNIKSEDARLLFMRILIWLWRRHEVFLEKSGIAHHKCFITKWHGVYFQKIDSTDFSLFQSLEAVEAEWVGFVLCTGDYDAFCKDHLGEIIHKRVPVGERVDWVSGEPPIGSLLCCLTYVYDKLGPEGIEWWFVDYRDRYPKDKIRALKLD